MVTENTPSCGETRTCDFRANTDRSWSQASAFLLRLIMPRLRRVHSEIVWLCYWFPLETTGYSSNANDAARAAMLEVKRSVQGEGGQHVGGRSGRATQHYRGETRTNRHENSITTSTESSCPEFAMA